MSEIKRPKPPSTNEIIEYWLKQDKIDVYETLLNFDWSDAKTQCWNCGDDCKKLTKCHITPYGIGKNDKENNEPSNFVLLCFLCHEEAPDMGPSVIMWDWIKSNKMKFGFYNTYRMNQGIELYEKQYNTEIFKEIIAYGGEKYNEDIKNAISKTVVHFGRGQLKSTTWAAIFRTILRPEICQE